MSAHARPTFTTTSFLRTGYAPDEVDAFLDGVFAAIAGGRPVPDITSQVFTARRGGYSADEVDDFLDELNAAVGGQEAEPSAPAQAQEQWLRNWLDQHRA